MLLLKIYTFVFSPMVLFVALLLISGRYRKVVNIVDQWIYTDNFFKRLDKVVVNIDAWFYKHNILAGTLLLFACFLINLRLWLVFY